VVFWLYASLLAIYMKSDLKVAENEEDMVEIQVQWMGQINKR
jgi:hypothetical protein